MKDNNFKIIKWLKTLLGYADGTLKWDTGCDFVCEGHPFSPSETGLPFDCKCGAPGMQPLGTSFEAREQE